MKIIKNWRHGFSRLSSENGTEMKKSRINYKRRGFTLMELIIAIALMSLVTIIALATIKLSAEGYIGTSIQSSIVREDTQFVTKLNKMIRESTTVFTIPEKSFNNTANLTAKWNYLGIMDGVEIPADVSRTGEELTDKTALVYIEYAGTTKPQNMPGCNVIDNGKGAYFYQKILGYSFTDQNGRSYDYDLVFNKIDDIDIASDKATYELTLNVTDENGNTIVDTDGAWVNVKNTINALNAIQIVYNNGGDGNPARAISFRSDFMPTDKVQENVTVVMILDFSGSMNGEFTEADAQGPKRITALRNQAKNFIDELHALDGVDVTVIMVPFSDIAGYADVYGTWDANGKWKEDKQVDEYNDRFNDITWKFDLTDGDAYDALQNRIKTYPVYGGTNIGDGIRVAYHELAKMSKEDRGKIFTVLMSDGEANQSSASFEECGSNHPEINDVLSNICGKEIFHYNPDESYVNNVDFYIGSGLPEGYFWCDNPVLFLFEMPDEFHPEKVPLQTADVASVMRRNGSLAFACKNNELLGIRLKNGDTYGTVFSDTVMARQYITKCGTMLKEFEFEKTWFIRLNNKEAEDDRKCLEEIFGAGMETVDISNEAGFQQVFEDIKIDINKIMWAFSGPDIGE